jgi:uncharacterized protein YkwD
MWLILLTVLSAPTSADLKAESDRVRSEQKLETQQADPRLTAYAQLHASHMAAAQTMRHSAGGFKEVIAMGYPTARQAFAGWLDDKPHRDLVLGADKFCGFGSAQAADGTWYWCGVFAPRPPEKDGEWPGFVPRAEAEGEQPNP